MSTSTFYTEIHIIFRPIQIRITCCKEIQFRTSKSQPQYTNMKWKKKCNKNYESFETKRLFHPTQYCRVYYIVLVVVRHKNEQETIQNIRSERANENQFFFLLHFYPQNFSISFYVSIFREWIKFYLFVSTSFDFIFSVFVFVFFFFIWKIIMLWIYNRKESHGRNAKCEFFFLKD